MKMPLRLLCAVALLAAGLSTWAFPTLFGDTGMVLAPTADAQEAATLQLTADYMPMKTAAGNTVTYPIRLIYGMGSNFELGVLYSEVKDSTKGVNVAGASAKMALLNETLVSKLPGVAVGIRAYREKGKAAGQLTVTEAYGAVSKIILARGNNIDEGFNLRAHTGIIYTSYSDAASAHFVKPYLGITYSTPNKSSLAIEYLPEQKDGAMTLRENVFSGALRLPLSSHFWLQVGTTRPFGIGTTNVAFAGVVYRFADDGIYEEQTPVVY